MEKFEVMNINSPPVENVKYCSRCCMPETAESKGFDEYGLCMPCRSEDMKMHIDWSKREEQLRQIFEKAKSESGDNYDCMLPMSGGKDSFFQAYVLTRIYKMKPLALTASHNWYSKTGVYNLYRCLDEFNLDHVMFTPNRDLVNRIAKESVKRIGDTCWHCHAGITPFALKMANAYNIPLLVFGESANETSGRFSYNEPVEQDLDYFLKVSAKLTAEEMQCETLSSKDLFPFVPPTKKDCEKTNIRILHLGDYIFWDEESQTEFIRDNFGWRETEMEGAYKGYKSAECIMSGIHDFTCYLKRGYGRTTFQVSADVRNGLLSKDEGFELSKILDAERPEALDYFLSVTGMNEGHFYEIMNGQKHDKLTDTILPISPKRRPNKEQILPFPVQIQNEYASQNVKTGLLNGVTFAVEDLFNTTGSLTRRGSCIFDGFVAGNDARCVFNCLREGAILTAKTDSSELGKAVHSIIPFDEKSPTFAAPALVKNKDVMFALTMHGGALMQSASVVGIYGLKPSFGLIPRTGAFKMRYTMDCPSIYADEIPDLRRVLEAVAVRGTNYPFSCAFSQDFWNESEMSESRAIRTVGVVGDLSEIPEAFKNGKNSQSKKSNEIFNFTKAELPEAIRSRLYAYDVIRVKSAAVYCERNYKDSHCESVDEIIEAGRGISLDEYENALSLQAEAVAETDEWLESYDVLVAFQEACGETHFNFGAFCSFTHIPAIFAQGIQIASRK
ncbi:MAG: N-acetyl sugar amidotransferase, partial [Oscillospiraceae bacterium]|nr:N-acetyl sugar amidotransferase [Oscillospiraceae bacterium]